jgi:hypothetical protein
MAATCLSFFASFRLAAKDPNEDSIQRRPSGRRCIMHD